MDTHNEEWRPVVGQQGVYEVSNLGRVRSLGMTIIRPIGKGPNPDDMCSYFKPGRILRPAKNKGGYLNVVIDSRAEPIQRLVMAAFVGPKPKGLIILHGDGVRTNNTPANLRYGTYKENSADMKLHGTVSRGAKNALSKLCEWEAGVIRALRGHWYGKDLAMLFDVKPGTVQCIFDGRSWSHAPIVPKEVALDWFWSFGPGGPGMPVLGYKEVF